jgi:hypothetical protein
MKIMHENIRREIDWATMKYKKYYDKKRRDSPDIQPGTRVYLKRRTTGQSRFNIRTGRESAKLDSLQLGPFTVKRKLTNDNYELQLPSSMRIHPIFHISKLIPTRNEETTEKVIAMDQEYEVEAIKGKRTRKGKTEYLVEWKGYSKEDDTWEPVKHLNCRELIRNFEERNATFFGTKNKERGGL